LHITLEQFKEKLLEFNELTFDQLDIDVLKITVAHWNEKAIKFLN